MKKIILIIVSICVFSIATFAQASRLVIKPNKVEYKRRGANVPDYKKTFEIRYPVVKNKLASSVRKRIETNLNYWRVFDMSLRENLLDDHWLSSIDYEIKYNKNYLLAMWLTAEGVGAYPDSSTRYIVLDIRNGKKLQIPGVFSSAKLIALRNLIRHKMASNEAALDADIKSVLKSNRQDDIYNQFHPGPKSLQLKDLAGFSINDKGVVFLYDYAYAHVEQAEEPPGEFFFTWRELKPYIKRDGLLGQFVR